jgi:hypothetical protein
MFQINYGTNRRTAVATLFSRGRLPIDCGDTGSIAVHGNRVAVTVDQGEVLFLETNQKAK